MSTKKDHGNVSRREFLTRVAKLRTTSSHELSQNPPERRTLSVTNGMSRRKFVFVAAGSAALVGLTLVAPKILSDVKADSTPKLNYKRKITQADREAAAASRPKGANFRATVLPAPGGTPDYFGAANYANSPLPTLTPSAGVALTGFTVQNGGSGYTTPHVVISGGGGSGATATARVSNGVILGLVLTNPGVGYTSAPTVTLRDPSPRAKGAMAVATVVAGQLTVSGGIRKFVNSLPGLGPSGANNIGQYIPIAVPNTTTFPGSDYYEIELQEYSEKMHSDLPPTRLRGYVQVSNGQPVAPIHYLGPVIVAQKNRPVRIKFTNRLPTGNAGKLFIPVDTSLDGAGAGSLGGNYNENRAELHLHGGTNPWISDGTPHQWTAPVGENTQYQKGVSVGYVPDMWFLNGNVIANTVGQTTPPVPGATNNPGEGSLTYYYNNQQSARLMFYHDHAIGITRLNVYVGEASGYVLTDQVEQDMINGTNVSGVNPTNARVLPDIGVPLVIQDRSYVDPNLIGVQDPTWNWGVTPPTPHAGDLWYPHVYVPAQNPYDVTGANPYGRWHYAPWFWPPATNIEFGPVPNPYYDPVNAPWEPPMNPGTPNPSTPGEAFMDTPVVNGTLYPYIELDPKTYRFRILNAANDRFLNLQLYTADPAVTTSDGRTNTEVKMVPANATPGYPGMWPVDGRAGGVPDPATVGPSFIQIGTEGGFLPAPVVVPNQPVDWNTNPTTFNFGNVTSHALLLAPAERADVLIDFSAFAGKTLILYNDAPAAFPALDSRYDYYTGNPDQIDTGGTPSTVAGFGPNIRTVVQIRVRASPIAAPYNLAALQAVFAKTASKRGVFEVSQDPIIIPQAEYNSAYNLSFAADPYIRQAETAKTFATVSGASVTIPFQPKAIQDEMGEAYDTLYGRMAAMLGLELPFTATGNQNFMLYGYASPPVDIVTDSITPLSEPAPGDGTQIWKITHNGVDTHPVHFHLFNVQLINRIAWDGAISPPDQNELGWKDTIRINPLEHTVVALRPVLPVHPFKLPNSIRLIDPTKPQGTVLRGGPGGFFDPNGGPITITNEVVNYGHEYVFHCHMLAHEEADMMHSVVFAVKPEAPSNLTSAPVVGGIRLNWQNNALTATNLTIQRATNSAFTANLVTFQPAVTATTYTDSTAASGTTYYYRLIASNTVGSTFINFPTTTVSSNPSNTASATRP